jgi:hypothetical protein
MVVWHRVGLITPTYRATTNDNRMQKFTITDTAHMHYIACYRLPLSVELLIFKI